ncbi:unnamed protein product [Peniophora sp. CBMAI 1063]|nr:unnamed protein product [Peniophora sp. CBMAI 1063]
MTPLLNTFHDASPPLHTHPNCDLCKQMRRSSGPDDPMKLQRCKGCHIARYCSKDCQMNAWNLGHKMECKAWRRLRDSAIRSSGNDRAWCEFAQWREYHHDSLTNAALAHYMMDGPGSEEEYLLNVILLYKNDPSLPVERKFVMGGCQFVHKSIVPDGSVPAPTHRMTKEIFEIREHNARQLKARSGATGVIRMGAYVLIVKFAPLNQREPDGWKPFYRHFQFENEHFSEDVRVNEEKLPAQILEEIFLTGAKQRFCCGKIPGLPTCCCGGWTHQQGPKALGT